MQVIAHRGGAGLRPENTLAAFAHAQASGADMLEMDVRTTADGAIVVLHDATVDRTTEGQGRVDALTLEALQRLDAGYRWSPDGGRSFPFRGQGIRVPALQEVFARFPRLRLIVEMKQYGQEFAVAVCTLIRYAKFSGHVLVASFDSATLTAFRNACPEVATSMSAREVRLLAALRWFYTPPAPALQIPDGVADLVTTAKRRNLKVHIWTVNDETRMRELISMGVDGIMTDRPDRLLELRRPDR